MRHKTALRKEKRILAVRVAGLPVTITVLKKVEYVPLVSFVGYTNKGEETNKRIRQAEL
jgi:hypothetical protein